MILLCAHNNYGSCCCSCSKHLSNSAGVDFSDVGGTLGAAGCSVCCFLQPHYCHERYLLYIIKWSAYPNSIAFGHDLYILANQLSIAYVCILIGTDKQSIRVCINSIDYSYVTGI